MTASFKPLEEPSAETQLEGYLSMSLRGKLNNAVPIVTTQRFVINQDHKTYQHLAELIGIRNRLLHNRASVFEEHDATWTTTEDGKSVLEFPASEALDPEKTDYTFGILGDVGRFHDALEDFYERFFQKWDPDDFKANDLIIDSERPRRMYTLKLKNV